MLGLISDEHHRTIRLDSSTHAQMGIEVEHAELHDGSSFHAFVIASNFDKTFWRARRFP
jgi:hypothetical protein